MTTVATRASRAFDLLAAHDPSVARHSLEVAGIAVALGRQLGLTGTSLLELRLAALLHDFGKLAVPPPILTKPGALDLDERALVERHPTVGADLLREMPGFDRIAAIVGLHHERWDGRGYPQGLSDERIPLASRIIAVADSFQAMVSDRPYRPAVSHDVALRELRVHAGSQFDPVVVEAFERLARKPARRRRFVRARRAPARTIPPLLC